jgi:Mrp family chromosome partitioning ATPase
MAEENKQGCSGNCGSCSQSCSDRKAESLLAPQNEYSDIKHVIGVISGKGGVGKSLVTSTLAVFLQRMGYKVGILDADITGPSIPKTFGIDTKVYQNEMGIIPAETKNGIKIMSINLLLPDAESPVIWRGPVIAGAVKQFWQDVVWGELDYLLVDCPPGTGDVPLTVFQSLPLSGAVIVTSPQDLVSMIVKKAYNMAQMMNIPVLGIVENMSYVVCPECGEQFKIFGEGSDTIAKDLGVDLLGKMPIDVMVAKLVDKGEFEEFDNDYLKAAAKAIDDKLKN